MRIDVIGQQIRFVPETLAETRMLQVVLIVVGNGRRAITRMHYGLDRETVVVEALSDPIREVSPCESSQ